MESYLSLWWVWVSIALALGVVELMLPAFIFLGIALGALAMAAVVVVFPGLGIPLLMAIFGILSLAAWLLLNLLFKRQSGDTRIVTHDINDG